MYEVFYPMGYRLANNFAQDDELIYIPGNWKYADGTTGLRITRIYVSSKESTQNGKRLRTYFTKL